MPRLIHWPLAFLALIPVLLFAAPNTYINSPWSIRAWQSDDGLPNNHVTGLAQTADGYLWVGTYSSLTRFDGVHFEEYSPNDFAGRSGNTITALLLSRGGGLWLGSLHGTIYLLNEKTVRVFSEGLPDKRAQTMVEDGEGSLWISYNYQGGTVSRIKKNGEVTTFTDSDGMPSKPISPCSLARDAEGRIWFAKHGSIGLFRNGRFETLFQLQPTMASLAIASTGGMWICSGNQLLKYQEGKDLQKLGTYESSQPDTQPTALLEDQKGEVWIGTSDSGLFHYNGSDFESVPTSDQQISSLAVDRNGHLWVGTGNGGLNQVVPRVIMLETVETGLPFNVVQSTCEDADGTIWATTKNGLLVCKKGGKWSTFPIKANPLDSIASCVTADPSGAVWIGTRNQTLYCLRNGRLSSWRKEDGLAGKDIRGLLISKNGDVWITESDQNVVQRLRDGRLETFQVSQNVRLIQAIAEDVHGNIWLGTSKGMLLRITNGVLTDETDLTTGAPLSIRSLYATPDGSLWIGYAHAGVGCLKDGHFARIASAQGFPENNVSQIVADNRGWLWFAGDHGIFKMKQEALQELAAGRATTINFIHYGKSEGLFSMEANFGNSPGASRSHDGRLWIPMGTALAVVDPTMRPEDLEPPPMLIEHVTVDDRVVASYGGGGPVSSGIDLQDSAATLRLPPEHRRIEFEFTTLDFGTSENVRFRYRLEGFDNIWIDCGAQHTASYSRLVSGNYRFYVQACNGDGVWNEKGSTLAFSVAPFFWQTWWFQFAALTVFTAMIAAIARYVSLRRVHLRLKALEQQAALGKERARIARDLHDELGARLTELGLIAELELKKSANLPPLKNGFDLVDGIRSLERELDTIIWAVNPKNDSLDHLVSFICLVSGEFLERSGISCRFDVADGLPPYPLTPDLRHHLFLVVREAVNNVIKHSGASVAKLGFSFQGDVFYFRLEDNGRGFSVPEAKACGRSGLKNMQSRIGELGGQFEVQSERGKGTVIEFSIPLKPIAAQVRLEPKFLSESPH